MHFNFKIVGLVGVETQKVKYERRHHTPFNPYLGERMIHTGTDGQS